MDFILTKWDREVDRLSINPGKQIFEKMISGMYMGEVVRQVLVDLYNEELIFIGQPIDNLMQNGRFYTKYALKKKEKIRDVCLARFCRVA